MLIDKRLRADELFAEDSMKYAIIILGIVAAVTALPYHEQHRHIRDVSEIVDAQPQNIYLPPVEPQNNYLPPVESQKLEEPTVKDNEFDSLPLESATDAPSAAEANDAITEAVPETAVLGENGYEYRTVRRLRFRKRRDVSHLNLEYLPPVEAPKLELNYLPPHLDVPQPMPQAKVSNEYLPPVNEKVVIKEQTTETVVTEAPQTEAAETEAPTTEAPTTEAPTTEAPTTQAPTTEATTTTEAPTTAAPSTAAPTVSLPIIKETTPQDTAILAEDGYHYKTPAVLPDLGEAPLQKLAAPAPEQDNVIVEVPQQPIVPAQSVVVEPELAYLPPLEFGVMEVAGPGDETSPLLDDGYHYRVVKQVRSF